MARISLFQSVALSVLAAVGTMAIPAQAQEQEPDRQEAQAELQQSLQNLRAERQAAAQQQQVQVQVTEAPRDSNRVDGDDGDRQARSQARQPQNAPQPEAQAADGERNGGQGRAEAQPQQPAPQPSTQTDNGWRSQRASDGQRRGRGWDNGGATGDQASGWRDGDAQARQDGTQWQHRDEERSGRDWAGQRNRTYSDPGRSGSYGGDHDRKHDHDRNGGAWSNHDGNRSVYGYGTYGYNNNYGNSGYGYNSQNYGYQNGYTSRGRDHNRWNSNDWRRDNRYNWSGYRTQHRDLYRAGQYYSPYSKYGYSRLSIGFYLNSGFYGQNYRINDPWQYRLPAVYGPYRWVRYYDDVLLVDIYSGEVVDVIHDFFW